MEAPLEQVLEEQRRYYGARAGDDEDWWFRRGRYAHGDGAEAAWFEDVERARAALARFAPVGRVLELACGTGLWTEQLAPRAEAITALDSSAEALALARRKVPGANIEWVQGDVFAWEPAAEYDVCFFAFWLSHVPGELMGAFCDKVARPLAPSVRALLVHRALNERATAHDHQTPTKVERRATRRLDDRSEFRIVKP